MIKILKKIFHVKNNLKYKIIISMYITNKFTVTMIFKRTCFVKMKHLSVITRLFSSKIIHPKICIIGAGPAGFYAAQNLAKHIRDAQIDLYERLPVPFGLVRFGVAPDHPEVKNVINTFTKTAEMPNVRFLGNINVGENITVKDLREAYHVVLMTYGAEDSRKLNIPGESLRNVLSARNIVGWYNGTPWDKDLDIDLNGSSATIIGQGNVAIDVARILLTPIDKLKSTDITQFALEKLSRSNIKRVSLIGRRGPLQAAFTIKELREMLKLPNCITKWNKSDFQCIDEGIIAKLPRPKKRITELMLKSLHESSHASNTFEVKFLRTPIEFRGSGDCVNGVILGVNQLEEAESCKEARAMLGEQREVLDCDLSVVSVGYKSIQIDGEIPFDHSRGVAFNERFKIDRGFYASGWLATGPTGVILTTMSNAFATGEAVVKDLEGDNLLSVSKPGFDFIKVKLESLNVQIVTWKDWVKIDHFEQVEGKKVGKPREKIVDLQKMLEVAA